MFRCAQDLRHTCFALRYADHVLLISCSNYKIRKAKASTVLPSSLDESYSYSGPLLRTKLSKSSAHIIQLPIEYLKKRVSIAKLARKHGNYHHWWRHHWHLCSVLLI
jgi:hypothetical protein